MSPEDVEEAFRNKEH